MPLRVTAELRADHALIRRGLEELRRLAAQVDAGMRFPAGPVAAVASFLREFAEHQHHCKEESMLLSMLAAHGADDAAEDVGELLRDHEESRALFYTLTLFWEPTLPLTSEESAAFVHVARTYADRLERHMDLEESRYFPLADHVIPGDEQLDLQARFAGFDAGRRTRDQWAEMLATL